MASRWEAYRVVWSGSTTGQGVAGVYLGLLGSPRSSASMSYDNMCLSQRAARLAAALQAQRVISAMGCMQDTGPINLR